MSQITFKKSSISDKFLKKTELKARYIFRKIIQATQNLNSYFGTGNYPLLYLYERVNCYLICDKNPSIPLRTFERYIAKLRLLRYQKIPLFVSLSRKLGKNQGTSFSAEVSPQALYAINKLFFDLKVAAVHKQKVAADIVYLRNLFISPVSKKQKKIPVYEQPTSQPEKSKEISPTEQISSFLDQFSRYSSATQTYKQALRDLENMGVKQVPLKEIERTLNHPIARENATLNLRDFLRDLGEIKRQSGISLYLQELKSLNGSMRLMRKGSEKYNTLLEEILNPKPKPATRIASGVLLPSEQNARFAIKPATPEEVQEIWKGFFERKKGNRSNY